MDSGVLPIFRSIHGSLPSHRRTRPGGDLQTAALVSSQGVVDWFAAPRFDSPSIFAALLDHDGGGYFRLAPEHPDVTVQAALLPGHRRSGDPVHVTRRRGRDDRLHAGPDRARTATDRHTPDARRALRTRHRPLHARMPAALRLRPGRAPRWSSTGEHRAVPGPGHGPPTCRPRFPLERDGQDVRGAVTLSAGESAAAVFTVCAPGGEAPAPLTVDGLTAECRRTPSTSGRTGCASSPLPRPLARDGAPLGHHPQAPHLRAHRRPVAAATMGLPEQVGGERNWDYRYTWVRDGSLSVRALLDLGLRRGGHRLHPLARRPPARRARAPDGRAPPDHVPGRRRPRPAGGDPRPLRGLPRLLPGPGRQRRRRPAPARHLRRGPLRAGPGPRDRRSRPATGAGRRWPRRWTGSPTPGTGPTRASGRPAAAARTSPTAG